MPAFATDDLPGLCKPLVELANAGSTHLQRVRVYRKKDGDRPTCRADGAAARAFCRWLRVQPQFPSMIDVSEDGLECLGHDREPPIDPDPDSVPGRAWFSGGTFRPESPTLAREHADVTMEINLKLDVSPMWIVFTARPK